jgi:NTP pyrophosphatase (non-canonical NTP hydrolase)
VIVGLERPLSHRYRVGGNTGIRERLLKNQPAGVRRIKLHLFNPPPPRSNDEDNWRGDKMAKVVELSKSTIFQLQQEIDAWIKRNGVRYFSELTNLAQLTEEVGELARQMSRMYGDQSFKEGEKPSDLGDELADILFVLICIANQGGVNLDEAWRRNIDKKSVRDQDRHRQNPKLRSHPI